MTVLLVGGIYSSKAILEVQFNLLLLLLLSELLLLFFEAVLLGLVLTVIRPFTLGLGLEVSEKRPVLLTEFLLLLHYLVNRRVCS